MKYLLLTLTIFLAACNQTATPQPENTDEPTTTLDSQYDLDLDSALEELEMVDEN